MMVNISYMLFKKIFVVIIVTTLFSGVLTFPVSAEEIGQAGSEVISTEQANIEEVQSCLSSLEICDKLDNNCNGEIDEGDVCQSSAPSDNDANDVSVNPVQDQILMELENLKASIDRNTPSERAYDAATAPGTVSVTVLDKNGLPESFQTFVSFVAVGGKTYGGAVDKDGLITTTLPSGRYYTDVLTTDPNQTAPPDLPGFFLEPEDDQTFGPFFLAEKTEPTEEEKQIQAKLEEPSGLASILNTIMHLLGEILKEVRK